MIDRAGEFKEWNPVGRADLRRAFGRGDCVGSRGNYLQSNVDDGGEVRKSIQAREQTWNQEPESGCPGGVVNVDSEDLIAYVRDSAF